MNAFLNSENSNIIEPQKVYELFTGNDQMIISYVCTNYYVYRWEFTPDTRTPKFQRLGEIEDIRTDFDVAYDKDGLLSYSFFTKERCVQLFNFLFLGFDIGSLISKRLLISPHERFEEVPFYFLGEMCEHAFQNTVLYSIPSLNLAYYLQKKRTKHAYPKKAICFGGAFFEKDDYKKADPHISVDVLENLINFHIPYPSIADKRLKLYLPGTLEEILTIQNLLNLPDEDIKKGIDSSKTNFLGTIFHNYKILHIATHGITTEEKTNVPVLLMSMVGRKNQPPDDGLLWYSDIANKSIPVECAVLSSCHSTSGYYLRGEGSYTIAKAFFIAGVKSVLSTFWTLNDKDPANFMKKFYSILFENNYDYAYSLMLAQQRSKQTVSEKIWGNFCYIGVWN